jgi:hypothetical protein
MVWPQKTEKRNLMIFGRYPKSLFEGERLAPSFLHPLAVINCREVSRFDPPVQKGMEDFNGRNLGACQLN